MTITEGELIEMFHGYVDCALWSSNDESDERGGDPLDDNYGPDDIEPETLARMRADCLRFAIDNEATLRAAFEIDNGASRDWSQAGHDFWLNRNGHGCGFWETPDWPETEGKVLDAAAKAWPEVNLQVDNGVISDGWINENLCPTCHHVRTPELRAICEGCRCP